MGSLSKFDLEKCDLSEIKIPQCKLIVEIDNLEYRFAASDKELDLFYYDPNKQIPEEYKEDFALFQNLVRQIRPSKSNPRSNR